MYACHDVYIYIIEFYEMGKTLGLSHFIFSTLFSRPCSWVVGLTCVLYAIVTCAALLSAQCRSWHMWVTRVSVWLFSEVF